jgi:hypothetical protein
MSLAINPVSSVAVLDPVTNINSKRQYVILKGGDRVTYRPVLSTSFSSNSAQFTAPPPSPGIIVDRKVLLRAPVKVTFAGTTTGGNLLQTNHNAFRAFPLSSIMNTLSATLNNTTASINMSDVIHPLLRYNTGMNIRDREYSVTPSMLDQYQNYSSGVATNRNPLGGYGDIYPESGRAGFEYTEVTNTPTSAVIEATLSEFLYLSPFVFGHGDKPGFIGIQNMDFNITWNPNLQRIWSHAVTVDSTISDITVEFLQPSLLFKYITPSKVQQIPRHAVYPYYSVNRYPTDSLHTFDPNQTRTLSTQNIQLNSIPRRMYIFARKRNLDLSYTDTDTYLRIDNINVNWNNQSGLLSSASQQDLYRMCVKNGLNMSWTQFNGGPTTTIGNVEKFGTVGSVLCVEFGTDIALAPEEAPGVLGTYQLQMDVTLTNVNETSTFTPTLYVIIVSEGTFTIRNNNCISQIGVISRREILASTQNQSMYADYNDIVDAYGGDFWSGLKHFGEKIFHGIKTAYKKIAPAVKKAAPYVKKGINVAKKIMPLLGLGESGYGSAIAYGYKKKGRKRKPGRPRKKKRKGGVLVGGKMLTRAQLKRLQSM